MKAILFTNKTYSDGEFHCARSNIYGIFGLIKVLKTFSAHFSIVLSLSKPPLMFLVFDAQMVSIYRKVVRVTLSVLLLNDILKTLERKSVKVVAFTDDVGFLASRKFLDF